MIQSAYNKTIEPKAQKLELPQPSKVSSSSKSVDSKKSFSSEKKREVSEFEKELKSAGSDSEPRVKEVKVSEEQRLEKPSKLVNPESAEADSLQPTIFDPEMTMDVEKAVKPNSAQVQALSDEEVLKLANGEVAELTTEAPLTDADLQKNLGDALAKGMKNAPVKAEGEVAESKLMSMEDFIAQKNMAKKPVNTNAYGAKTPQMNKLALENGLKQNQVVNELGQQKGLEGQGSSMNSQQFILNMQADNGAKTVEAGAVGAGAVKTFDMSQIKTSNPDQIMNQITDYIVQAKAAKEPTVTMRVNHEELGMIDITVQKHSADSVAINIGAHTLDGKNFFQQNSKDLFAHLTSSGVNVADLKLDSSSQTSKNDFDMNGGQRQAQQGSEKQFGSEQNQRRHESDRRQDLWKLLNKEAA